MSSEKAGMLSTKLKVYKLSRCRWAAADGLTLSIVLRHKINTKPKQRISKHEVGFLML